MSETDHLRLVVGVDGSAPAVGALRWALDEARRRGADVEVITCWHQPSLAENSELGTGYVTEERLVDTRALLAGMLARIDADVHDATSQGRQVTGRLLEGQPGPTLVTEAKSADLLVVGRRGLAHHFGSVSRYVVSHAMCPVVVIPPTPTLATVNLFLYPPPRSQ